MAQRVDTFPADATPIRRYLPLDHPDVVQAVDLELWDSAYPGDDHTRRLLALDIIEAIQRARTRE